MKREDKKSRAINELYKKYEGLSVGWKSELDLNNEIKRDESRSETRESALQLIERYYDDDRICVDDVLQIVKLFGASLHDKSEKDIVNLQIELLNRIEKCAPPLSECNKHILENKKRLTSVLRPIFSEFENIHDAYNALLKKVQKFKASYELIMSVGVSRSDINPDDLKGARRTGSKRHQDFMGFQYNYIFEYFLSRGLSITESRLETANVVGLYTHLPSESSVKRASREQKKSRARMLTELRKKNKKT